MTKTPTQSARAAKLRYVDDSAPGIRRVKSGSQFRFQRPDGKPVRDRATLARIKSLVIPPAYRDVWICPYANGHLQYTGIDDRGRKQYRYHPKWREVRDTAKYERMIAFGKILPALRSQVAKDLRLPGLPREKVLAAIVRLLDVAHIRIGNEEYAQSNKSYGLTTLQDRHAKIRGGSVRLSFVGKSGKRQEVELDDPRMAKIVRKSQDLPGQELFQYLDDDGKVCDVKSEDVNDYIREITGEDFTAKDFRTWAGTVQAASELGSVLVFESMAEAKRNVVKAIAAVADKLNNTAAVCRKCYIHPAVIEGYLDHKLPKVRAVTNASRGLSRDEQAVLRFLKKSKD
ncbi:MAG: DNA topoisomerase IB [Gemmataceae bacterium]